MVWLCRVTRRHEWIFVTDTLEGLKSATPTSLLDTLSRTLKLPVSSFDSVFRDTQLYVLHEECKRPVLVGRRVDDVSEVGEFVGGASVRGMRDVFLLRRGDLGGVEGVLVDDMFE